MSCGIYKITNNINNKCYIGQSIDIERRWRDHKKNYLSSNYPLYLAFKKYGLDNFTFEILEECNEFELDQKEIYWIDYYHGYSQGYNQTTGGQGSANCIVKLSAEDICVIYDLLLNSNISQNDIAEQFHVGADTISEINHGKTRRNDKLSYPLRKNKNEQKYCLSCGKPIYQTATYCIQCLGLLHRRVNRPERDKLKELIRTLPFVQIGKLYNVSDNTIRRWCDAEHLPRKASDIKKYTDKEWKQI